MRFWLSFLPILIGCSCSPKAIFFRCAERLRGGSFTSHRESSIRVVGWGFYDKYLKISR